MGASDFETKDSGARARFESGMQRDTEEGKPRFDLMLPLDVPYDEQMITRLAALFGRGAVKYESRNWEQANSAEEMARMKSSAFRHFMQWMAGETDEDHAAAVMFNIIAHETTAYKVAAAERDRSLTVENEGRALYGPDGLFPDATPCATRPIFDGVLDLTPEHGVTSAANVDGPPTPEFDSDPEPNPDCDRAVPWLECQNVPCLRSSHDRYNSRL